MGPATGNLCDPKAVLSELYDDNGWIKTRFTECFSSELLKFSEAFGKSFVGYFALQRIAEKIEHADDRMAFVCGIVFGFFDDLLISVKLLVNGQVPASGNALRQSIEGVAVALLCASPEKVAIKNRNQTIFVSYIDEFKAQTDLALANRALSQIRLNATLLGLTEAGLDNIEIGWRAGHDYSHPNFLTAAMRMSMKDSPNAHSKLFFGGNFDDGKIDFYRKMLQERIDFCLMIPNVIEEGLIPLLTRAS